MGSFDHELYQTVTSTMVGSGSELIAGATTVHNMTLAADFRSEYRDKQIGTLALPPDLETRLQEQQAVRQELIQGDYNGTSS